VISLVTRSLPIEVWRIFQMGDTEGSLDRLIAECKTLRKSLYTTHTAGSLRCTVRCGMNNQARVFVQSRAPSGGP
jgi:hypothetical protein